MYASSDVNIVMMMFFELFFTQKVVGSFPAWELRNFSE